jgi:hypothetical protein
MKKRMTLAFSFLLVIMFQNCAQTRFASADNPIENLPFECPDQASCYYPAPLLNRYGLYDVTELTYSRSGGFPTPALEAMSIYAGVRVILHHNG